jgi:PAS domain S-box-containing protein
VDGVAAFEESLEAIPDGIFVSDEDGRITFLNHQAEVLSGYNRHELIGSPIEVLVPAMARTEHVKHRQRYYESGPAPRPMGTYLDIHVRRKDGDEFPADVALGPVRLGSRLLIVAAVRDVSERQRTELRLRRAEERYRRLVEGVSDHAIFMLDAEGRITSWSPGASYLYGYRTEEILGHPLSALYPPEAAEHSRCLLKLAHSQGRAEDEGWQMRGDGSRFWANAVVAPLLDEAGLLRGYSTVARDTTERRRAEQSLQAALEVAQAVLRGNGGATLHELIVTRARTLVDADLALLLLADGDEGYVIWAADGVDADRLLGLRIRISGALLGTVVDARCASHLGGVAQAELRPLVSAVGLGPMLMVPLLAGERRLGGVLAGNRAGGARFSPFDLRHVELFAAQAAIALDYDRVQAALGRLALVEDRERIGRELHDGAIQALFAVGMNLEGAASMTEDVRLRQRLDAAVDQIDVVIRELRDYIFGLRPAAFARRDLEFILSDLAAEVERESGITATVDLDRRLTVSLTPYATDLVQMIRESLSNVVRHARAASCRISLREHRGRAIVEVTDDGHGFNPEEPMDAGWGLRNLRERAARLGARFEIRSQPGAGTAVRITLPLRERGASLRSGSWTGRGRSGGG